MIKNYFNDLFRKTNNYYIKYYFKFQIKKINSSFTCTLIMFYFLINEDDFIRKNSHVIFKYFKCCPLVLNFM